MNMIEIAKKCDEIYTNATAKGRAKKENDTQILNFVLSFYCKAEIDFEEVIALWTEYLEKGNLNLAEALKTARARMCA